VIKPDPRISNINIIRTEIPSATKTVDRTWETDNDTGEDTETLPDAFSGFRKGFLLKPPDRTEPKRLKNQQMSKTRRRTRRRTRRSIRPRRRRKRSIYKIISSKKFSIYDIYTAIHPERPRGQFPTLKPTNSSRKSKYRRVRYAF
jgi:hypothetical protein